MLDNGRHVLSYGRVEKGAQLLPESRWEARGEGLEIRGPKVFPKWYLKWNEPFCFRGDGKNESKIYLPHSLCCRRDLCQEFACVLKSLALQGFKKGPPHFVREVVVGKVAVEQVAHGS